MEKELVIRGQSSSKIWDYENSYYWFSHPTRINKLLAHYELYKSIIGLPGHVVELGVYKGASLVRFASFRNLLENDFSRMIIGFDAFGKFPTKSLELETDKTFIEQFEEAGGDGLDVKEIDAVLKRKNFQNVTLVKGNVFQTIPEYLDKNPETKIALLHFDLDVKEPTAFALEKLYDRVVSGGLIVLDDYNAVAGETEAVDEFCARHKLLIEKTTHYYLPSFIRKP